MRSMIIALLLSVVALPVCAQQKVWPIIAFASSDRVHPERELLVCLDRLTNIQQLVAADDGAITKGGYCTFGTPRVEFDAFWVGFHESERFIFPVVELDYHTDGQTRFSNDGIYLRSQWKIERTLGPDACMRNQLSQFGGCIVPKECSALRGLNIPTNTPTFLKYIKIPPRCNNLR